MWVGEINFWTKQTANDNGMLKVNEEALYNLLLLLLLLLVFSPWAGLGRDQSSVRRLVWLWYAATWASS